jgi:hypothetical protein
LIMLEGKTPETMSWDLGYHHAKRGVPYNDSGAQDKEGYKRGYTGAGKPRHQRDHYTRQIMDRLPEIAKQIMSKHVDAGDHRNTKFLANPDSPAEHSPKWHQWGVVTHTRMFGVAHEKDVPRYLQQWGIKDQVDRHLDQEIDGQPKRDLLRASIPLHDLGKFTHRTFEDKPDGSYKTAFTDHEAKSGEIIRDPKFADDLKRDYNLTDKQIEYIARCAELHFTLGILRKKAKMAGAYNMNFPNSPQFPELARDVMKSYPGFELEMGLLFIGDSMAKTNIRIDASTDEEIEAQHNDLVNRIDRKLAALPEGHKFNPKLIQAAKQMPVNIAVGKKYLQTWAADQSAQGQYQESVSRRRLRLLSG